MVRFGLFVLTIYMVINGILSQAPTRDTKLGTITGVQHNVTFRGTSYTVDRYLGIPYAKPPIGNLRFQKPVASGNFTNGKLMATQFGESCPQFDFVGFEPHPMVTTEDCLSLNIFVPTVDTSSGHAVMIFIHGGGFASGTSRMYLADTLAARGNVIVVTINYRVWLFGLLNLKLPSTPGNVGLWDQQMAIQWVHDNIHSFGGDPNRVTVFGQSAGSFSASYQSLYPGNRGLINGVITESGSPFTTGAVREDTIDTATLLASKLQCDTRDTNTILACFQHTSVAQILQVVNRTLVENPVEGAQLFVFTVTVDGEFIKDMPRTLLNNTSSDEVQFLRSLNLISGFNKGEGALFAVINDPNAMSDDFGITRSAMNTVYIPNAYKTSYAPGTKDVPKELISLIGHEYTDWKGPNNSTLLRDQYSNMMRDLSFGISAVEYSKLHAGGASNVNNYLYLFETATDGHISASPGWIRGAVHGDELPFLFGFPSYLEMKTGNGSIVLPGDREFELSDRMISRWANFAKTGDPNIQGEVIWPKYTIASEEYMKLDWKDRTDQYLLARPINFWYNVLSKVRNSLSPNVCVPGSDGVSSATCVFVGLMTIFMYNITSVVFSRLI